MLIGRCRDRALLVATLALVSGCSAGRDLDKMCAVAGEVVADPAVLPAMREAELTRRVEGGLRTKEGRNIFAAAFGPSATGDAAGRKEVLRKGAVEVGRPRFSCPALDSVIEASVPQTDEPIAVVVKPASSAATREADSAGDAREQKVLGDVRVGPASVSGGTVADANRVVAGLGERYRLCYNFALKMDPKLAGSATLVARVGPTGEPTSVTSSATFDDRVLVQCFERRTKHAVFAPPQGGSAVVTIPVFLAPRS